MFKKVVTLICFILSFCWLSLIAIVILLVCDINLDYNDITGILAIGLFPSMLIAYLLIRSSEALEYMREHPEENFFTAWAETAPPEDPNDWA